MSAPVILTIVALGLIVLTLAAYLLAIIRSLAAIDRTLDALLKGLWNAAEHATPVATAVTEMNSDATAASDALTARRHREV